MPTSTIYHLSNHAPSSSRQRAGPAGGHREPDHARRRSLKIPTNETRTPRPPHHHPSHHLTAHVGISRPSAQRAAQGARHASRQREFKLTATTPILTSLEHGGFRFPPLPAPAKRSARARGEVFSIVKSTHSPTNPSTPCAPGRDSTAPLPHRPSQAVSTTLILATIRPSGRSDLRTRAYRARRHDTYHVGPPARRWSWHGFCTNWSTTVSIGAIESASLTSGRPAARRAPGRAIGHRLLADIRTGWSRSAFLWLRRPSSTRKPSFSAA